MRTRRVDLWKLHERGELCCITTNYGWKSDGCNVMGRGNAAQAAGRYPMLPKYYGIICRKHHYDCIKHGLAQADLMPARMLYLSSPRGDGELIAFPTKRLNVRQPHLSWRRDSCLEQIVYSMNSLKELITDLPIERDIYLPRPGCGNGRLEWSVVKEALQNITPKNVVFVDNN